MSTDTPPSTARLADPAGDRDARSLLARLGALLLELLVMASGPMLLMLVHYFSWGAGLYRFAMLCALALLVGWLGVRRKKLVPVLTRGAGRYLLAAGVAALFMMQVRSFVRDIAHGGICTTDMGKPSICAGEWLLHGDNPWAQCATVKLSKKARRHPTTTFEWCLREDRCVDRKAGHAYKTFDHHGPGFDFMDGYKYGPMMMLAYLPAGHLLRERGIYLTNFVFWLGMIALLYATAVAAHPKLPSVGLRALGGLLFTVAIPIGDILPSATVYWLGVEAHASPPSRYEFVRELTKTCANDVIPVVLLLAAVLLCARKHSAWAGVLIGLSMAAKQLPAPLIGLLLVFMDGVSWKRLLSAAVVTATLCYLPFFVWAPREMTANLLLFNMLRPTNSSSIRELLPAGLESLVSLAQLAVVALCVLYFARKTERTLAALLPVAAVLIVLFIALNKVVHGNYLLWVQPFVALALAGAPYALGAERRLRRTS
ncbi:MAG TPA: glycosyltransferase family 87 protein [Polyangiales bacterium]